MEFLKKRQTAEICLETCKSADDDLASRLYRQIGGYLMSLPELSRFSVFLAVLQWAEPEARDCVRATIVDAGASVPPGPPARRASRSATPP